MIDTNKYEGHTEGPWNGKAKNPRIHSIMASGDGKMVGICYGTEKVEREDPNEDPYESIRAVTNCEWADWARADARLIADAPLILEAYKRLREALDWVRREETRKEADYIWEGVEEILAGDSRWKEMIE